MKVARTRRKGLKDILVLGDPRLYQKCDPVSQSELHLLKGWVADMHNAMEEIRSTYHFGRAIAAPQLGIMKRLIYMNIDQPQVIVNPELSYLSPDKMTLWDDCMSFPQLLVKVERHCELRMNYRDENWEPQELNAMDDLAELLQHEYDHLEGILCTMRAVDDKSFKWRTL